MPSAEALATVERYAAVIGRDLAAAASDLDTYLALLSKWQAVKNLVSRETLPAFWERHVKDSLQLLRLIGPTDRAFLDLGSGGGFPAIPLAIARRDDPESRFVLVESNQRKVSFLRSVARELGVKVEVIAARAEEIDSRETFSPDIITSRALAPLPMLSRLAAPLFAASTRALFHKGREFVEELEETRAFWHFDVVIVPSDTSADGVILEMRNLRARAGT
jgi:16S rRNA (guanine527-N7)-methyltransferase